MSPVVANFYMERFKKRFMVALTYAPRRLKCWFSYVYDIFVVWSLCEELLFLSLDYLNSINTIILFIVE